MREVKTNPAMDWFEREKQRRMLRWLLFFVLILALIGYYYYVSALGNTGIISGVNFDTTNYIAFVRNDGKGHTDLYAIKVDGTGERRLTSASDASTKGQPIWTLDSKSLLYTANLDDSRVTQIYLLGDGQPTRLTYGSGNKLCPAVSPDGQHAAFIAQGAVKSVYLNGKDVYQLMPQPRSGNEQGGESAVPTSSEPQGPFLSASFSSDGSGIAGVQDFSDEASVSADRTGADMAVTCIPPGGGPTMVLDSGHEVSLSWEKTGNRLACAFTELRAPNHANADKDTHNAGYKEWLNLTKTDKETTLVSAIQIFTFGGKTPTVKNLFRGYGYSIEPKNIAWSPDGSRMAFEGWRLKGEGERELKGIVIQKIDTDNGSDGIVVDAAHVNMIRYIIESTSAGKPQNPKWSPDSKHILFEMVLPDGNRDLWSINADGTNAINLTKGKGDNSDGAWAPIKK